MEEYVQAEAFRTNMSEAFQTFLQRRNDALERKRQRYLAKQLKRAASKSNVSKTTTGPNDPLENHITNNNNNEDDDDCWWHDRMVIGVPIHPAETYRV